MPVQSLAVTFALIVAATAAAPHVGDHVADTQIALQRYAEPADLVEIAPGRRLNLRCQGTGTPTVILEAGLGFPSISWRNVQPRLAALTRTCSYDRAGLGFSDPGPVPRHVVHLTEDQERLVAAGKLDPPYVLVGSSLGGQIVRLFAFRHPQKVAGLVLVDPYVEGQYKQLARIAPGIAQEVAESLQHEQRCVEALRARKLTATKAEEQDCIPGVDAAFPEALVSVLRQQRMSESTYEAAYSESLMLDTDNEIAVTRETRALGRTPLVILAATGNYPAERYGAKVQAELTRTQMELERSLAKLSEVGRLIEVNTAHVIQVTQPDAVIEAVAEVLATADATQVPQVR